MGKIFIKIKRMICLQSFSRKWHSQMKVILCVFFLQLFCCNVIAQKTIKGTVTGNEGPLVGVSVSVKGTKKVVLTDKNGDFVTNAKPTDKLEFSFVGMEPQTITVGNRSVINVKMEIATGKLDDVTVVAFGTQKKESVVSSITTISPKELRVPSSNLTTALAGRLAGVISYQRSGEPGQEAML